MIRLLWAIVVAVSSGFRSRRGLMLENLALRQQLSTVLQKRRPRIGLVDRAFWVVLRRVWARWSDAVEAQRINCVTDTESSLIQGRSGRNGTTMLAAVPFQRVG
jgi:hypothetical protein